MKKPTLSEMTLREKIGQMLAPHQWDVFGKVETNYDGATCNMDEVRARYEKEQFGTLRGEQVGVYYTDPRHSKEFARANLICKFTNKASSHRLYYRKFCLNAPKVYSSKTDVYSIL